MSDEDRIQQKMQQFIANIRMNTLISEDKKQQLIRTLQQFEQEAEGVFEEFEESILLLPIDDTKIIHPDENRNVQQQNPQQLQQQYGGPHQYSQNQNIQGQSQQYYNNQNQQQGQRGQPGQYQQQQGRPQIGSSQPAPQQMKPQSSQSYGGIAPELTPEQKRQYIHKFQTDVFKKYVMNLPPNDPQAQTLSQKYPIFADRQQTDILTEEERKRIFDYNYFLKNQFKMFDENIKNCIDPQRKDQLYKKYQQLYQKVSQDQMLYSYFMDEVFQGSDRNDRKIMTWDEQTCIQYYKLLIEFYSKAQNPQICNMLDQIFKSKEIRGYEQFLRMLKEKNLDNIYKTIDDKNKILNSITKVIQYEINNHFNKIQLDQNQKKNLQKNFVQFLQKKHLQYQYRENIMYNEIAQDPECPDKQLMMHIVNTKDFQLLLKSLNTLYHQSQEIMNFQRLPPRQQFSSQNPNSGLNSSQGPGPSQIGQYRGDEPSRQAFQRQPGYSSQQPLGPTNQLQSEPQQFLGAPSNMNQNISQGLNKSQNLSSSQQSQQNIIPQNIQQRNMSEQSYKQEDEKRPSFSNSSQQQQLQGNSSSQQKIAGINFQDESTPQGSSSQIKQEGAQQQVKQTMSTMNPYQLNSSSSVGQSQTGGMMSSQLNKTKAKRLLSDDNLIKKLNYFCEENKVEQPSPQELQNILSYINEVFKTYMKNLIERLLQSSIVENIDNEFRLFCSDKLEQHLVPFRGQSIEKYLLNKADPSGAREMTFLKYYIVQSENKNIRRGILEKNDEEIEQACYESISKHSLFDKSIMKFDLDRTQRKGCSASEEIKLNILKMPPIKSKGAKKDLKQESMPQAISLATTNCQRQKITLKNIQLFLEADPIYRKSAILLKTYLN